MPVPHGTRYRIKTYKSGKRVRQAVSPSGRIVETKNLPKKKLTKSQKRLNRRKRRIGR